MRYFAASFEKSMLWIFEGRYFVREPSFLCHINVALKFKYLSGTIEKADASIANY